MTGRIHPWDITALQKKYANYILITLLEPSSCESQALAGGTQGSQCLSRAPACVQSFIAVPPGLAWLPGGAGTAPGAGTSRSASSPELQEDGAGGRNTVQPF